MRIIYCIDSIYDNGAIARVTLTKANALSRIKGNKVFVIVAFQNRAINRFPLDENVIILNLDIAYYGCRSRNPLKWVPFLIKKRNEHKKRLEKVLHDIAPDIVISTGRSEKNFLYKIKNPKTPSFILEKHEYIYSHILLSKGIDKLFAIFRDYYEKWFVAKKYDKVVDLTQEGKEIRGKHLSNSIAIPNPLINKPTSLSSLESKIVIAAGRLEEEKNFKSMILAWKHVKQSHPEWKLNIYGDGSLKSELQRLIDCEQLTEQVKLKGYANDIMKEMTYSSMLLSTSICEGFGLVLIEAMACGLPVVSYDYHCGPKDIIKDGENGFIVAFDHHEDLADKICQLIEDESLRKKMGQTAQLTSSVYSLDKIIKRWMSLFEQLREGKNREKEKL